MSVSDSTLIELSYAQLDINKALDFVVLPWTGGTSCFVGTTRSSFQGKHVKRLEYEAYEPMAIKQIKAISDQVRSKWAVGRICVLHRLGEVSVKEASIVIAVSAEHRQEALHAVEFAINEIKATVPIWKKEVYEDKEGVWKENAECKWNSVSSLKH